MLNKHSFLILLAIIFVNFSSFSIAAEIEDNEVIQAFAGQNLTKPVFVKEILEDEAVNNELKNTNPIKITVSKEIIKDKAVEENESIKTAKKPIFRLKLIDEHSEIVRVKVSSMSLIEAKSGINEGQTITFKVLKDVYKNEKIYINKGSTVDAYVETLTPPSFGGDPAEISVGRFSTTDINGNKIDLTGEVQKQGANRALWVRPLADIASNVPIYGAPLLLLYFVKGGNAKINTTQEFELCYE